MSRKPSITVVQHNHVLSMLLQEVLAEEGYATRLWTECAGAFEFIRRVQPDLVILDLWLRQHGDGWQVFDRLQHDPATHQIPVILCTDDTLLLQLDEAQLRARAAAVLEKPFDLNLLVALVADALMTGVYRQQQGAAPVELPARALGDEDGQTVSDRSERNGTRYGHNFVW